MQTRFHIRRKVFALLLCLFLSVFLWLLNDLNTLQTSNVQIPVKFTGLPYDMVTTNTLPSHMEATVEATGFDLLWRHLVKEHKVVEIPLRIENGLVSANKTYLFNINYYMDDITDALGSHLKIKRIFPDTFSIRFDKKFSKKVPVELLSDFNFEKEFNISGKVLLNPDSVVVYGTQSNIASIHKITTQLISLNQLKSTYIGIAKLNYMNGITYNTPEVKVKVPVEQFTEKKLSLPIVSSNVPSHYELNTIPNMATVKVLVPISDYGKINAADFKLNADFPASINSAVGKIILTITNKPEFVQVVSIEPESVEYKIKQHTK